MKSSKNLFLASLLLVVSTFACSKDDDASASNAKSSKEILMASEWKKSEYKENGVITPFYGSCEMDDILTFAANGNYTINDGANVCENKGASTDFYVIDPDNKTMRWGLYGAGEISFNSTNTSFTFKRTGAYTFEYIFVKK
ncbi:hypothetical protein JAO76_08520 [Pontibacter sp. BT310]|uniref:Lipocalin-like domain-containing protein n=1 Tax=Pontibacter populi TaxID=890055 RepID=A0ABS6XAQ5_9BACT|nr:MULTISPECIES: hypothetical protein [Pontibacter]MBJ6118232.1 hypothetical protein [Pontibacter sp. BT310]MBR0570659.1 hypothetical protein [Microvirga sp. STS03]MBW3365085.1 hypothetical protein [Pontibacter populi]